MALLQCCSKRDMQDIFFGATSNQAFREAAKGRKEGDCQWCFELTQHFTLGSSTTWMCDNCKGVSEPCEECRAMVRVGFTRRNNSKSCARCTKTFKKLSYIKAKVIRTPRSFEQLRTDLERKSEYRTNAARSGMLRCFLHLVSLSEAQRMQIAINLGWTLIIEESFGDSHFESWDIISHPTVGLAERCKTWRHKMLPWAKEPNWYTIMEKLCTDICLPSYMNWSEEFNSRKLGRQESDQECRIPSSTLISSLELEFLVKIGKQQRSRMTSLQVCCLAELRNAEPIRKLLSMSCVSSPESSAAIAYGLDAAYLTLARRDGSDGSGAVLPLPLLAEIIGFSGGLASGEEALFAAIAPDVERDIAPPGSILNSNASFFWLTIEMLDIEFSSDSGRILPAVLQMLLQRGRMMMHGIRIEDFMTTDFEEE